MSSSEDILTNISEDWEPWRREEYFNLYYYHRHRDDHMDILPATRRAYREALALKVRPPKAVMPKKGWLKSGNQ